MLHRGEGTRARGRPPRGLQVKQQWPLARLIALGAAGPEPPHTPLASQAVGLRTTNSKAGSGSWAVARYWAKPGAQFGSPRAGPGDQLLVQLRPLTVRRARDSGASGQVQRAWGG